MRFVKAFVIFGFLFSDLSAEVIWKGEVNSNGTPTPPVTLELGQKYQIKVSGTMNLGNWRQNGESLEDDACHEFNAHTNPVRLSSFRNSMNIAVCDGKYHADHVYTSQSFVAAQSQIHFWIYDSDYSDNKGSLLVEVIKSDGKSEEKAVSFGDGK